MPSKVGTVGAARPSSGHDLAAAPLPAIGEVHHRVAPTAVVELGSVVRMWEATGGQVSALRSDALPLSSTSLWSRPAAVDPFDPLDGPLRLHFDVKAALGFNHAVIARYRIHSERRTRVGDAVGHHQVLRRVGDERMTALGWGRSWDIDHVFTDADGLLLQTETFTAVGYRWSNRGSLRVDPTASGGDAAAWTIRSLSRAAAACRVWSPVHHDLDAARRAGLPGVIACTQHLAAVLEQEALRAVGAVDAVGSGGVGGGVQRLDLRIRRPAFATRCT